MITRKASRIIVVNDHNETLLVRYEESKPADPRLKIKVYWVPPGGGVSEGETFEDAAICELYEETGISVSSVIHVWLRERELVRKGTLTLYQEGYFCLT